MFTEQSSQVRHECIQVGWNISIDSHFDVGVWIIQSCRVSGRSAVILFVGGDIHVQIDGLDEAGVNCHANRKRIVKGTAVKIGLVTS